MQHRKTQSSGACWKEIPKRFGKSWTCMPRACFPFAGHTCVLKRMPVMRLRKSSSAPINPSVRIEEARILLMALRDRRQQCAHACQAFFGKSTEGRTASAKAHCGADARSCGRGRASASEKRAENRGPIASRRSSKACGPVLFCRTIRSRDGSRTGDRRRGSQDETVPSARAAA